MEAIVLGLPDPDRARQPEAAQEMTRLRELIGRTMDTSLRGSTPPSSCTSCEGSAAATSPSGSD